jgi:hypothetical protein
MLLFIDESGHDRKEAPYEVLAGVALAFPFEGIARLKAVI